jgi:hypothetical protein
MSLAEKTVSDVNDARAGDFRSPVTSLDVRFGTVLSEAGLHRLV